MNRKKIMIMIRCFLGILAVAIPIICIIYSNATGNYLSDIVSKLIISLSCLLIISSLLISIRQYPQTRPIKIGTVIGMALLLIMQWL